MSFNAMTRKEKEMVEWKNWSSWANNSAYINEYLDIVCIRVLVGNDNVLMEAHQIHYPQVRFRTQQDLMLALLTYPELFRYKTPNKRK